MMRAVVRRLATGKTTTHLHVNDAKPPVQDMPPPGGYPSLTFEKATVARGPPGWAIWLGAMCTVAFGFYRVGMGNRERNAAKKEKREARMAIVPYLQAEEDVKLHARYLSNLEDEATIMKGVKGWEVGKGVYNNPDIYVPPAPTSHPRANRTL